MELVEERAEPQLVPLKNLKPGTAFRDMDERYGIVTGYDEKNGMSEVLMCQEDKRSGAKIERDGTDLVQRQAIAKISFRPWPLATKSETLGSVVQH